MDQFEGNVQFSHIIAFVKEEINKNLFGDIMTIVDASVLDPVSRKALKSLVSQSFSRRTVKLLSELNKVKLEDKY